MSELVDVLTSTTEIDPLVLTLLIGFIVAMTLYIQQRKSAANDARDDEFRHKLLQLSSVSLERNSESLGALRTDLNRIFGAMMETQRAQVDAQSKLTDIVTISTNQLVSVVSKVDRNYQAAHATKRDINRIGEANKNQYANLLLAVEGVGKRIQGMVDSIDNLRETSQNTNAFVLQLQGVAKAIQEDISKVLEASKAITEKESKDVGADSSSKRRGVGDSGVSKSPGTSTVKVAPEPD